MEVIGVICEFNPFHNGHKYFIDKIRKQEKNALIIAIVSNYFTERGEVSILSKEDKTKAALTNGIDIVVELPVIFATQSADIFALSALNYLNYFHITKLYFGTEEENLEKLNKIVELQNNSNYQDKVKKYLNLGNSYPTSLAKALELEDNIFTPNNLLAISYLKSINLVNKNITPVNIKRTNDFNDLESSDFIISASNIRKKIEDNKDIKDYVPKNVIEYITSYDENKLFNIFKMIVLRDDINKYLTVDEGFGNRVKKYILEVNSFKELTNKIKTKRYTYNRIRRMYIHIILGILKNWNEIVKYDYVKVLGFNKQGRKYLKTLELPLKINYDSDVYKTEVLAAYIYEVITNKKVLDFELANKPVIF